MKTLMAFLILVSLLGCEAGSDKTPQQVQAEMAASQEKFNLERQRIEKENREREEKIAMQRSFVSVSFVSVNPDRIEVLLSNNTDKAIDNQSGALDVLDAQGNYVTGIALTNWVPGNIYLPVGGSNKAVKKLALETEEQRSKIVAEAANYQYYFTMHKMQFVGEDEINFLDNPFAQASPTIAEPEPANPNQASPEACAENQLTIETDEQYYPGSQCEHMERNIDSERFKVEYMRLCQNATKAASAPTSTARVQLSSCMNNEGGQGIVYRKRICCDVP